MTDLATRNDTPRELFAMQNSGWDGGMLARVPAAQVSKGERLREWLDLFIKTEQVANVLAKTTFVPKAMQHKPAEVAAAMMRGFEMNVDPLDALAHMFVINGKVGYSAEFMRRRIIEAGHEILFPETTDSRAIVKARRREHRDDETKWQTFVFTEDNARKAKIDLGGYPADKLVARASSRMCRRMFPEVLAGASIAEDLIDAVVIEGGDSAGLTDLPDEMRPALPRRSGTTAQRKRQPRTVKADPPQPKPTEPATDEVDDLLDEPGQGGGNEMNEQASRLGPETSTHSSDQTGMSPQSRRKWLNRMFQLLGQAQCTEQAAQLTVIEKLADTTGIEHRDAVTDEQLKTIVNQLNQWDKAGELIDQVADILDQAAIDAAQAAEQTEA